MTVINKKSAKQFCPKINTCQKIITIKDMDLPYDSLYAELFKKVCDKCKSIDKNNG